MLKIKRKYHFYAAHRNESLKSTKCNSLHGHQYEVFVLMDFETKKDGIATFKGVKMTFEKIDSIINTLIKKLDHALLINSSDPLLKYIEMYERTENDPLKKVVMECYTSVENVSEYIYKSLELFLPVVAVTVQETKSAEVTYHV